MTQGQNNKSGRGSGAPVTTGSCLFNDIDTGTNAMACDYNVPVGGTLPTPNCTVLHSGDVVGILPGYSAAAGYDQATGLGSLNVANVVNAWTAVAPGTSTATVTVTPSPTTLPISEILAVTVTVAGPKANVTSNGTAVAPTGSVTLTAGTFTSPASALSSSGTSVILVPANSLSVGTNAISVSYSGDVLYGAATGASWRVGAYALSADAIYSSGLRAGFADLHAYLFFQPAAVFARVFGVGQQVEENLQNLMPVHGYRGNLLKFADDRDSVPRQCLVMHAQ